MAERIELEATKRSVVGKQVKHLRANGVVPGVLYGPTFETVELQMEWAKLQPVLRAAGGSHVIQIMVAGEEFNALVREVQRHPLRGEVLHVDFYRVRMDVAIRTEVPVVLVGSDDVIVRAGGVVNHEMTSVEVECLPGDLPARVEVNISGLQAVGDHILTSHLPELPGVTYMLPDEDVVVVSTSYLASAEEEEAGEAETSSEPELIRRRLLDEEEEA
jgi:large subunit ribosomal protein L25